LRVNGGENFIRSGVKGTNGMTQEKAQDFILAKREEGTTSSRFR